MLPTRKSLNKETGGFTLLEVLLSLALISILATISIPVTQSWQQNNDINVAAVTIGQTLRRSQALSQAMAADSAWGVAVDSADNNKIILFRGDSFGSRDPSFDEEFDLPSTISLTGLNEIVYSKSSGLPSSTGSFNLTSINNQSRGVTVNVKGIVGYQ